MNKLLHIIATPRAEESRTLKVSGAFLDVFKKRYPDSVIDTLNVATENLPPLTVKVVSGKYVLLSGKDLTGPLKDAWDPVVEHIERFLSADTYLISTPMWNFSIPYTLKHYIDVILQPKYLFRYTEKGAEGLVKNKKMLIITSRGGEYSENNESRAFDFQEPYLRTVFEFVGITEIAFIHAQPMDALGPDVQIERLQKAQKLAREIAEVW